MNLSWPRATGTPPLLVVLEPLELTELGLLLAVGILVRDVGVVCFACVGGGGGEIDGGAPARGSPTL